MVRALALLHLGDEPHAVRAR